MSENAKISEYACPRFSDEAKNKGKNHLLIWNATGRNTDLGQRAASANNSGIKLNAICLSYYCCF